MRELTAVAGALAEESRTRALMSLRGGELCVCKIVELLDLAPSTVSKHLTILHQAGLVASRKEGRWIYYRLPGRDAPAPVREALRWLLRGLARDPTILQDEKRLKTIHTMTMERLCRRYKCGKG
jgi:DNA-binding transcriptional ArsR family regulator